MMRQILKSKIAYATVTQTELYYEGSITIDEKIAKEAELLADEKVEVLNLNNGARFETYVIFGEKDSGMICLNGPAARLGMVGDKVIILSYGYYREDEIVRKKTKIIVLDDGNKIKSTTVR